MTAGGAAGATRAVPPPFNWPAAPGPSAFSNPAFPLLALPVLGTLAAGAALGHAAEWICAVAVIVVLGVPHGALDVEIGRTLLRHRAGRWWFPAFAGPYLVPVAAVLLMWRWAPVPTLAAFLLASVWHFGTEGTGDRGLGMLAWGGLPIAVPVLLQPAATARLLSAVAGVPLDGIPPWLLAGSVAWLVPLVVTVARSGGRGLGVHAASAAAFALLPPLPAFALYFVAIHSPAHVAALVRHPTRAPRVRNAAAAWWLALPTTLLTAAIAAALWPFHPGEGSARLVSLTVQLLAAFTLPHMLLDAWLDRRDRAGQPASAPAWRRNPSSGSSGRPSTAACSPSTMSNSCTPGPSSR